MSDDIIVSGGGSVVVASDSILALIDRIGGLGEGFRHGAAELLASPFPPRVLGGTAHGMPPAVAQATRDTENAIADLAAAGMVAGGLDLALRACLWLYGEVEKGAERASRVVSGEFARQLGLVAPFLIVPVGLELFLGEGVVTSVTKLTPAQQEAAAADFLSEHSGILNNPVAVGVLEHAVMDVDDFGEGFLHLPAVVGGEGLGAVGLPASAAAIVAIGNEFGLLEETGVKVQRTTRSPGVTPPTSLAERMARIPDPGTVGGDARIRIDRYSVPGQPDSFDVYIAGTEDFGLKSATEPFDMTSNIVGVAHDSPASYRAVLDAMRKAGVTPTSPVVLTGYSQGGLVASLVAASGDYNVKGLATFGAPAGQVPVPASVPTLTVRHAEDIVPATGGYDVDPQAVVVERSLFDDSAPPSGEMFPAHERRYYAQTATLVDAAQSSEVRSRLAVLDAFGAGAAPQDSVTTTWTATRVSAATSSGR